MKFIKRNHRLFFFLIWFLINLIQAGTTELFDDEAYYWIYSQYPAWGYFDHPPMIAWLIKAGYTIFPTELGVRLFMVLMNTATLFIILKLAEKKNDFLFYAIGSSIAVAQIGGIIAVPDIPLLFFVSLFLVVAPLIPLTSSPGLLAADRSVGDGGRGVGQRAAVGGA